MVSDPTPRLRRSPRSLSGRGPPRRSATVPRRLARAGGTYRARLGSAPAWTSRRRTNCHQRMHSGRGAEPLPGGDREAGSLEPFALAPRESRGTHTENDGTAMSADPTAARRRPELCTALPTARPNRGSKRVRGFQNVGCPGEL